MTKTNSDSVISTEKRIVRLGKARQHTRASNNETYPEMASDKTQRFGG